MRKEEDWKLIERGMLAAMREGSVAVPTLLLRLYRAVKLSDTEAMLLIHLLAFKEKEGKDFPTLEELQSRMSAPPETVIKALQRLIQTEIVQIDEDTDPVTGVRCERYNLLPLYRKLAAAWVEEAKYGAARQETRETGAANGKGRTADPPLPAAEAKDIFTVFEKEFARPLTPMECETISQWLDRDRHSEELILTALKEAVFAGVVNFRYIDRILLEWSRNRIHTPEQAKAYTQKFRGAR